MKTFRLYGTSACHLCDTAEKMLLQRLDGGLALEKVDISESDRLFERYGLCIPVLGHPDGRELNWPFEEEELEAFLAS